jgi:hypothetical protein
MSGSLDRERDLELVGRGGRVIGRRLALAALAAVVVLALLNVFGQVPARSTAHEAAASLQVDSPTRLRGGLLFQGRFEIVAARRLAKPKLLLSRGWLDSMTLNTIEPAPVAEDAGPGGLALEFEALAPGRRMIVWTQWQVNPTNVGRHDQKTTLLDDNTRIASIDRKLTVFP